VKYSYLFRIHYTLELETLKGTMSTNTFKEPTQREDAKKVREVLEDRYKSGKNKWFFQPLRVRPAFYLPSPSDWLEAHFSVCCPAVLSAHVETRH
jgi:large subunit ribosomal protein L27e